jgi:hypothetical protein
MVWRLEVATYNELLDEDGLSDTCTTEETNLTTTGVRGEKVDDLDTGNEDLGRGGLLDEGRRVGVNGSKLDALDGSTLVNWVSSDVHDATETARTDGDLDGGTGVGCGSATDETLSTCVVVSAKCPVRKRRTRFKVATYRP